MLPHCNGTMAVTKLTIRKCSYNTQKPWMAYIHLPNTIIEKPVHLLIHAVIKGVNHVAAMQCMQTCTSQDPENGQLKMENDNVHPNSISPVLVNLFVKCNQKSGQGV